MNEMLGNYQLRETAGTFWLIDMAQSGEDFVVPLQLNGGIRDWGRAAA